MRDYKQPTNPSQSQAGLSLHAFLPHAVGVTEPRGPFQLETYGGQEQSQIARAQSTCTAITAGTWLSFCSNLPTFQTLSPGM